MGNHTVGTAMHAAARAFWRGSGDAETPSQEAALAALDEAAEDFIGADAEFDDYLYPPNPLARLVAVAFNATPEEIADGDIESDGGGDGDLWYDGPVTRFRQRYKFC